MLKNTLPRRATSESKTRKHKKKRGMAARIQPDRSFGKLTLRHTTPGFYITDGTHVNLRHSATNVNTKKRSKDMNIKVCLSEEPTIPKRFFSQRAQPRITKPEKRRGNKKRCRKKARAGRGGRGSPNKERPHMMIC